MTETKEEIEWRISVINDKLNWVGIWSERTALEGQKRIQENKLAELKQEKLPL